jgi:hypothetical protein
MLMSEFIDQFENQYDFFHFHLSINYYFHGHKKRKYGISKIKIYCNRTFLKVCND